MQRFGFLCRLVGSRWMLSCMYLFCSGTWQHVVKTCSEAASSACSQQVIRRLSPVSIKQGNGLVKDGEDEGACLVRDAMLAQRLYSLFKLPLNFLVPRLCCVAYFQGCFKSPAAAVALQPSRCRGCLRP